MSNKRISAKINLANLKHNAETLYQYMPNKTAIMAVIKADGYGHGALKVAETLYSLPFIYGFATATAEEAMKLRRNGIRKPILILGYVFPEDYHELIENEIRFSVFKEETVAELSELASRIRKKAYVHLKVDTGMTRIGIMPDESGLLTAQAMFSYENVIFEGVFTHFAKADETDKSYTDTQYQRFTDFIDLLRENGMEFPISHCANSATILDLPKYYMNLTRAGIVLYGLWPSEYVNHQNIDLLPVMSVVSHIIYIREIEKGVSVSYGGTFIADRKMRIATVPVGYADGYPRSLSNKGYVLINGQKAPIVGRVCMDQMMVDITDISDVNEYDEVVLLGKSQDAEISAEELGNLSGRFNYELVCDFSPRVERVYELDS